MQKIPNTKRIVLFALIFATLDLIRLMPLIYNLIKTNTALVVFVKLHERQMRLQQMGFNQKTSLEAYLTFAYFHYRIILKFGASPKFPKFRGALAFDYTAADQQKSV